MLNTKEYFNQLDATIAIEELDDETAASCSGGKTLKFGNLRCIDNQDGGFGRSDELSLRVDGRQVWETGNVDPGDTIDLSAIPGISGLNNPLVELYEKDPGRDDRIGSFRPKEKPKNPVPLNGADAKYTLEYRFV